MIGENNVAFVLFLVFSLTMIVAINGGLLNFSLGGLNNMSVQPTQPTNDCQSYIDQIDLLQKQNTELLNTQNTETGSFSPLQIIIGFIIGAGVVIAYFLYHENEEKRKKEFDEMFMKARRKR